MSRLRWLAAACGEVHYGDGSAARGGLVERSMFARSKFCAKEVAAQRGSALQFRQRATSRDGSKPCQMFLTTPLASDWRIYWSRISSRSPRGLNPATGAGSRQSESASRTATGRAGKWAIQTWARSGGALCALIYPEYRTVEPKPGGDSFFPCWAQLRALLPSSGFRAPRANKESYGDPRGHHDVAATIGRQVEWYCFATQEISSRERSSSSLSLSPCRARPCRWVWQGKRRAPTAPRLHWSGASSSTGSP